MQGGDEEPLPDEPFEDADDAEPDGAAAPPATVTEPPPMKRVQVSNQVDILGELDNLRKQATMPSEEPHRAHGRAKATSSDSSLDLDSLLGGPTTTKKELRHKVAKGLNSGVFSKMHKLQIAMRIQDASGETIHILEPVQMNVGNAAHLQQLMLYLTVDLENSS
jgi:hypothetical protein